MGVEVMLFNPGQKPVNMDHICQRLEEMGVTTTVERTSSSIDVVLANDLGVIHCSEKDFQRVVFLTFEFWGISLLHDQIVSAMFELGLADACEEPEGLR